MCHILGFCNDCFDHFHVSIWNDERIIGQRERIIGQRSTNNNNNTHIAAIAPLPLTTHPQSWAELLTFGPKCTLPF